MKCFFSLSFLAKNMTNITEFIDLELGVSREEDWGLFIILDEEENRLSHRRTLLKNIVRISTIYEDEAEDEAEAEEDEDMDPDPEFSNGAYANEATCTDRVYGKMDYYNTANWRPTTTIQQDGDSECDNENENECEGDIIQLKMQFLVTYVLTTSFSIALIILTFTI